VNIILTLTSLDISLEKIGTSKVNKRHRINKELPKINQKLQEASIEPKYVRIDGKIPKIRWEQLPPTIDPSSGEVSEGRVERKREQIENLVGMIESIAKEGDVIVDFCAGGGHLGIVLAYRLPKCHVIMIDLKMESIKRARSRIHQLKLANTTIIQSNIEYFHGHFDIGTSLHSCGVATDLILDLCLKQSADFVLCPCCFGALHHISETKGQIEGANSSLNNTHFSTQITYPRSQLFRKVLTDEDFFKMGRAAERTEWDFCSEKSIVAKRFMGLIDTDRLKYAEEKGYSTCLTTLDPIECSPKNDLILGTCSPNRLSSFTSTYQVAL